MKPCFSQGAIRGSFRQFFYAPLHFPPSAFCYIDTFSACYLCLLDKVPACLTTHAKRRCAFAQRLSSYLFLPASAGSFGSPAFTALLFSSRPRSLRAACRVQDLRSSARAAPHRSSGDGAFCPAAQCPALRSASCRRSSPRVSHRPAGPRSSAGSARPWQACCRLSVSRTALRCSPEAARHCSG